MEAFFRKYMWAINFGLLGVGSLLSALLVNGFVATQLAPYTVPAMPQYSLGGEGVAPDVGASERDGWVEALAGRCLFGCVEHVDPNICPEGCPEGQVCEAGECIDGGEDEEQYALDIPVVTELNMVLSGAMVASNPRWSMAMIRDEGESKTHIVGVGDMLPAESAVEVLEIRRDRVFIDNGGNLEFIRMVNAHEGNPGGEAQRASRSTASGRTTTTADRARAAREREAASQEESAAVGAGVRSEGNNRYTVDRTAVQKQLEDPAALTRQARIMPNYRDGEPSGLRLVGVTPNSFYSQLGIRSGDVIQSVNGTAITNQRQAMQLLERLQSESQVTIEVERRGRTEKMQYTIE